MASVAGTRSATATLTASTVDDVTLSGGGNKRGELIHHGDVTDVIYFRTDGTDPVVAADECEVLLPNERLAVPLPASGEVRLISAGAATYTVLCNG